MTPSRVSVPPIYPRAFDFHGGLAWVKEEHDSARSYFINTDGERVLTFDTDCEEQFQDGLLAVRADDLWGFVDKDREWVAPPTFDHVADGFHDGLAGVQIGSKWGFVDTNGDVVIQPRFDRVWSFSEGPAAVEVGSRWGYVNAVGDIVIDPTLPQPGAFHDGRCRASVG